MLGGIAAAAIVSVLFPGPSAVQTKLGAGTSIIQGLFIEMFLTAQLTFTIFMLATEKHRGTFIAPIGIGLSLFIAELTGKPLHSKLLSIFVLINHRCLLHRRFVQSSSFSWPIRYRSLIPRISLDLLGEFSSVTITSQ